MFRSPVDIAYFVLVLQHGIPEVSASTCLHWLICRWAFDFSVHRRLLRQLSRLAHCLSTHRVFFRIDAGSARFINRESGCTRIHFPYVNLSSILNQAREGRSSRLGCLLYTLLSILIVVVNRCLWITRVSSLSSYLSTTCAIFLAWRSVNLCCTWKMNNFFHRRNKQAYPETINRLCTSSSPSRCPQAC